MATVTSGCSAVFAAALRFVGFVAGGVDFAAVLRLVVVATVTSGCSAVFAAALRFVGFVADALDFAAVLRLVVVAKVTSAVFAAGLGVPGFAAKFSRTNTPASETPETFGGPARVQPFCSLHLPLMCGSNRCPTSVTTAGTTEFPNCL